MSHLGKSLRAERLCLCNALLHDNNRLQHSECAACRQLLMAQQPTWSTFSTFLGCSIDLDALVCIAGSTVRTSLSRLLLLGEHLSGESRCIAGCRAIIAVCYKPEILELMSPSCNMAAGHLSSATVSLRQRQLSSAPTTVCCSASKQFSASTVPACWCRVLSMLQAGTSEHLQLTRSLLGTADMVLRAHAHAIEEAAGGAGDQAGLRALRARVLNHLLNPVLEAAGELPDLDTHVLLLPYCISTEGLGQPACQQQMLVAWSPCVAAC